MSMIGPEGYRMDHEGDSWEELATERARLNRSLRLFEHHHEELLNAECPMDPGPDVVYQCELEYLRELFGREDDEDRYLFDLDRALDLLAPAHGLLLDKSHHDGMVEGLPYNLDFYVWHRENAEDNGMFWDAEKGTWAPHRIR